MKTVIYTCDLCDKVLSGDRLITIPVHDTRNHSIAYELYHVCASCEIKVMKALPVTVYGVNNPYGSNRKPKFREEEVGNETN